MAKFQLEMGGKNPLVVLDDADLDVAVELRACNGGFFSTGQRCTASSRLIVTEGIHDRFVAARGREDEGAEGRRRAQAGTDIGPVVDDKQLAQDLSTSRSPRAKAPGWPGGGEAIEKRDGAPGYYMRPRCSPRRPRRCASTAKRSSARW